MNITKIAGGLVLALSLSLTVSSSAQAAGGGPKGGHWHSHGSHKWHRPPREQEEKPDLSCGYSRRCCKHVHAKENAHYSNGYKTRFGNTSSHYFRSKEARRHR